MDALHDGLRRLGRVACFALAITAYAQQAPDARILNEQGLAAAARGDYNEAERLFSEALAIWRARGPEYSPHVATVLVNLGQARCNAGRWRDGVGAMEEALALNRGSLGPKHLRTVYNLSWLGHAYLLMGDVARAESTLTEALVVERELYPNDPIVGQTLLGLSFVRRRQERLEEAITFGEEALRHAAQNSSDVNVGAAMAYQNVAELHQIAGRPERALPLFRKARFIYEQTQGPTSPALASAMSQEGIALFEDGKPKAAETDLTEAVDILSKKGPTGEYRLAMAETNLGKLRMWQNKYTDAARLLMHALTLENRLPVRPVLEIGQTLRALAQVFKAQHKDSESTELLARADALQAR